MTHKAPMPDQRVVTYTRDGNGYGAISCSWEDEPRKTNVEDEAAREEHRKASKRAEECRERAWDVRHELEAAINADIEKAKAELSA